MPEGGNGGGGANDGNNEGGENTGNLYEHKHYVVGYEDGMFKPDRNITRAEVATIIARTCLAGFVEGYDYGNPGGYTDVNTTNWYSSAVAYCSMKGVFNGYTDGTFKPDRYITREELAVTVARMAGLQKFQSLPFTDASGVSEWALDGVYTVYVNGWITGYPDGAFRPQNDITRAETVRIFNGYLNRGVDADGLKDLKPYTPNNEGKTATEYITWPDVPSDHWAYYDIIEASNDHSAHYPDDANPAPPERWVATEQNK